MSVSSLGKQLNVPQVNLANSGTLNPAIAAPQATQVTSDFSVASSTDLQSETLAKLGDTGQADQFSCLANNTNLTTNSGVTTASDSTSGSPITTVGSVVAPPPPASATPITTSDNTQTFKVTLTQAPTIGSLNTVTFDVMPTIQESGSATYKAFTPIQHPGEILKYEGSSARTWNIDAKLISRTVEEATKNIAILNLIRSWRMPFYGQGTANNPATKQYLGAPPPILTLTAYGSSAVGPVPCVLENYNWTWPNDVDWIHTASREPFPVIITIALQLKESQSPAEFSGFDLVSYKTGNMKAAFTAVAQSADSSPPAAAPIGNISTDSPKSASATDTITAKSPSIPASKLPMIPG